MYLFSYLRLITFLSDSLNDVTNNKQLICINKIFAENGETTKTSNLESCAVNVFFIKFSKILLQGTSEFKHSSRLANF